MQLKDRRDIASHSRGVKTPESGKSSAPIRAWGMPGAQCTRSLACKIKKHTSVVTTSPPESPGIPARDGVNGCFVFSPELGLFGLRRPGNSFRGLGDSV